MERWQVFENECAEYLQKRYADRGLKFIVTGGHDSNKSDIQVLKNNSVILSMECKMSASQCGQFVLYVDELNKKFLFSAKNKTPYDDYVEAVIREMESKFDECNVSSQDLPISENVISQWVKNYYINVKKSSYCISRGDMGFVVFPMECIDKYFKFSAKYRVKKSGSSNPSRNNISEINELLKSIKVRTTVAFVGLGCYASFSYPHERFILCGEKYRYQFTKEGENYRVRRLSNTSNANFIVSIRLKKFAQDCTDLRNFESTLR